MDINSFTNLFKQSSNTVNSPRNNRRAYLSRDKSATQNFRTITRHPDYQYIEQRLTQLHSNQDDINFLAKVLEEFQFFTNQEQLVTKIASASNQDLKDMVYKHIFGHQFGPIQKSRTSFLQISQKSQFSILKNFNHQKVCKIFAKIARYIQLSKFHQQAHPNTTHSLSKIKIVFSQDQQQTQSYSKEQILYILCLMALNLVPHQEYQKIEGMIKKFNWNNNFSFIFSTCPIKTKTILDFFQSVFITDDFIKKFQKDISKPRKNLDQSSISIETDATSDCDKKSQFSEFADKIHNSDFIIKRNPISSHEQANLLNAEAQMGIYEFLPDSFTMQQYILPQKQQLSQKVNLNEQGKRQKVQIDFANKHISGGALTRGMVQEEIIYMNHPELFATIILCESLKSNEALYYSGFKKYFKNVGYGRSLSHFLRESPQITKISAHIVAIDALDFRNYALDQYEEQDIKRQIVKAYAGFNSVDKDSEIVTGNWGCGIFCGDHQLKFIIQWIAGSLADRRIIHCPYGEQKKMFKKVSKDQFLNKLKLFKVRQVYDMLMKARENKRNNVEKVDLLEKIYLEAEVLQNKREEEFQKMIPQNNQCEMVPQNHQNQESEVLETIKVEEGNKCAVEPNMLAQANQLKEAAQNMPMDEQKRKEFSSAEQGQTRLNIEQVGQKRE